VQVANVSKELKSGEVWFEPIFRYNEQSPEGNPAWEKLGELHSRNSQD
jgi:pilus assembly protein CpaF